MPAPSPMKAFQLPPDSGTRSQKLPETVEAAGSQRVSFSPSDVFFMDDLGIDVEDPDFWRSYEDQLDKLSTP